MIEQKKLSFMKYIIALLLFCFTATTQVLGQRLLTDEAESVTGEDIVERAMKYIGVPYRSGNMNPKIGFDCSGFTTYVFKKENILLTRSSRTQFKEGVKVDSKKELQKGDLVFFAGSSSKKTIGHVGIVTDVNEETGAFSFIHASRKGICISSSTEPYYSKRYVGARRVLEA